MSGKLLLSAAIGLVTAYIAFRFFIPKPEGLYEPRISHTTTAVPYTPPPLDIPNAEAHTTTPMQQTTTPTTLRKVSRKEREIEDHILKQRTRVIDEICTIRGNCFQIEDQPFREEETRRFVVYRKVIPRVLQHIAVSMSELDRPEVLTWENFNTKTWKINKKVIVSAYNQLMVTSMLLNYEVHEPIPHKLNVLLIGLGGGVVSSYLNQLETLEISTTVVDVEPIMETIANKWFQNEANNRTEVIIEDGILFLEKAVKKGLLYDSVLLDACVDDRSVPILCPVEEFLNKGTLQNINGVMTDRGILSVNLFMGQAIEANEKKVLDTFREHFTSCFLMKYSDERKQLICSKLQLNWPDDSDKILERLRRSEALFENIHLSSQVENLLGN